MQFHPPAFKRRHQWLNLERVARKRIPQQKNHGGTNDQQDKSAQRPGRVATLVVQVEQGGDQRKQHEYFVQIADGDMADVRTQQMAFTPRSEEHTSELQSLMRISYA